MRKLSQREMDDLEIKAEIYQALYADQPIAKFVAYENAGIERLLKAVLAHNEPDFDHPLEDDQFDYTQQ